MVPVSKTYWETGHETMSNPEVSFCSRTIRACQGTLEDMHCEAGWELDIEKQRSEVRFLDLAKLIDIITKKKPDSLRCWDTRGFL